jgi:hypothetical protein
MPVQAGIYDPRSEVGEMFALAGPVAGGFDKKVPRRRAADSELGIVRL